MAGKIYYTKNKIIKVKKKEITKIDIYDTEYLNENLKKDEEKKTWREKRMRVQSKQNTQKKNNDTSKESKSCYKSC